jgi:hypothetical protein
VGDIGLTGAIGATAIVESETAVESAAKGELNVGKGEIVRVDPDCVHTDKIWGLNVANVVKIGCKVVLLACHHACLGEEK